MQEKVDEILAEIESANASSQDELEQFRMRFISKKSVVGELFAGLKDVPNDQKKAYGMKLNEVKQAAQNKFKELIDALESSGSEGAEQHGDLSLPPAGVGLGSMHPLTYVRNQIIQIFERIGFNVSDGPEIEDDFHNFTALNFPENHPAREMQDTFFIERNPDILLRTHTSGVQVRLMTNQKPPLRSIMPGRVYRNEAISARAHCVFHQVEGIYVDKNVSFVDLKQTLYHFAKEMFGKDTKVRFRPSYFPFTEPSAEIDISCQICKGDGCQLCKYTGWVEIGGSGMVDPNVLANCDIDPEEYTGFAFGMGVERITQLKFRVNDLRLYTENDVRFLQQFKTLH
ncbi:phenylalanine--tRNA ligase subunit alpha [Fulvivirga sediminis]|uniref:Phenylalanine--tRNA ligase alpha subunit n=1 Tax=Fulvivirga sediminis TaxID=2803949 RepID=A0A937F214_9BACT|nr:phenylalanine--tRNA ligase subunit alpha [Fulvivirga sediminis]MBL3654846.1 phenylalanine--tRNA ligase subunit alpha [Fulvivirga sediminis]